MKKLISIVLIGVLAIGLGAMSFASAYSSPSEVYANLANKSVAEAYRLKGAEGTFGDLAKENGFYKEFSAATLAAKIAMVKDKAADGILTTEDAAEIIAQLEDCDGTMAARVGQFFSMRFGADREVKGNYGGGEMAQSGEMNEDAPRLGQSEGTPQARTANQVKDFSGSGSRGGRNK
jgi:hypothetical protein